MLGFLPVTQTQWRNAVCGSRDRISVLVQTPRWNRSEQGLRVLLLPEHFHAFRRHWLDGRGRWRGNRSLPQMWHRFSDRWWVGVFSKSVASRWDERCMVQLKGLVVFRYSKSYCKKLRYFKFKWSALWWVRVFYFYGDVADFQRLCIGAKRCWRKAVVIFQYNPFCWCQFISNPLFKWVEQVVTPQLCTALKVRPRVLIAQLAKVKIVFLCEACFECG